MGKRYQKKDDPQYKMPSYDFLVSQATSEDDMITRDEMISILQALPDDSKICITQDGNYGVGDLAYIYRTPIKVSDDNSSVYSIGHSEQSV